MSKQNVITNKKCLASEMDKSNPKKKKSSDIMVSNLKNNVVNKQKNSNKNVIKKEQTQTQTQTQAQKFNNDIIEDDSISKISSVTTLMSCPTEYADDSGSVDDDSVGTSLTNDTNAMNAPDIRDVIFTTKEKYYFKTVDKFYRKEGNIYIKIMVDIIEGRTHVSLRLIEWFITRHAYKKKISYCLKNDRDLTGSKFPVHISYKSQLKAYKKKYFDPFRRKKKFMYSYYDGDVKKKLFTTIGQLNFFLWAFDNGIIDYIFKHYDEINKAMIKSNKDEKKNKAKVGQVECKPKTPEPKEIITKKPPQSLLCTTLSFD